MTKKFPKVNQRQSFPQLEEEILKFWRDESIFEESISSRPEQNPYRFYDGPPFITGTPHYGSLLSSICKDVVPRYWTMKGKRVERVWGWDCHGLPIEDKVMKKLGLESSKDIEKVGVEKFIEECYAYTKNTSAEWDWYIEHIGRWVDTKNAYRTMDQTYMETVMWVFSELYKKGLVYKGQRVSLYSRKLSTPISNFEVAMDDSYQEVSDPAITVMFPITTPGKFEGANLLAWTTTPWTIPAHMAIAINKDLGYSKVRAEGQDFILATTRVEIVFKGRDHEIIESFSGEELVGVKYTPPFSYYTEIVDREKNFRVYNADFVTDTDGTGIAHEAPEFGDVDFQLAKREGIYITGALDDEGKYTNEIAEYKGIHYQEANDVISNRLKEMGKLFKKESINHRVAMCPRTATPLIYKAQDSWFIDIQSLKAKLIEENEGINWYPEHLKYGQFLKSMEGAPDWCISRTRYWGTPMPVWKGYDTEGIERDIKVFGSKEDIELVSGKTITDLHKPYIDDITWQENGLTYKRIPEVLDVWMDSGSMPYAQMHYPFENKGAMEASYPADFIVEYIGQVRAWFYVMHVVGVALLDKRSFTNVITTGIVYGSDGRKMSKSYGNYPDPRKTIEKYGADAIRFYMMNSPLLSGNNMSFKEEGIEEVIKKVILPLWNTYSFFTTYANIDNWNPKKGGIYYCRHGETDNNKNGLMNGGDDDIPLNDEGKDQAFKAVEEFKQSGIEFDVIIYSPLSRAKETASIIWNGLGRKAEFVVDERLLEQKWGKFKGLSREEAYKMVDAKDWVDFRRKTKSKEYNGAEDVIEFNARVTTAYKDIQRAYEGKNILIVGHNGTFRPIIRDMYNLTMDEAFNIIEGVPNAKIIKLPGKKTNLLDQWILGELNILTKEIDSNMKQYKIAEATRPIVKFMDNLTNWYIRRSRKRFWKSENDNDKIEAYETLYDVLITLSKILAPFTPFISEHIYKNLTENKSVHLEMFPTPIKALIIESINTQFDKTAQLINLGLAWRQRNGLRVRQPLLSATIGEHLDEYYIDIIKEELNVKEVIVLENSESIAKKICKPNGKLIGPKFGKDVQKIISEAKAGNFKELGEGKIDVSGFILEGDEYEIAFEKSDESLDIEAGFGMVIALDKTLTPELIQEGIARDLVRHIQEGRKEADFQVDDRIEIEIAGENLEDIIKEFKKYIEEETLSTIYPSLENEVLKKEVELESGIVTIKLRK